MPAAYRVDKEAVFHAVMALRLASSLPLATPCRRERTMSHSMRTADSETHVRIVAISLAAGIVIVLAALHDRLAMRADAANIGASAGVNTASRPAVYSLAANRLVR
jgi:hypothetical protein